MVTALSGTGAAHQGELPQQAHGLALGLAHKAAETGAAHPVQGQDRRIPARPDAGPDAIVTISHEGKRLAATARRAHEALRAGLVADGEGLATSGTAGAIGPRMPHGIAKKLKGPVAQAAAIASPTPAAASPSPLRTLGASVGSAEGPSDLQGRAWGRRLHAGQLGSWSNQPQKAARPLAPASIHEIVRRAASSTVDKAQRARAAQSGVDTPAQSDKQPHPHAAAPAVALAAPTSAVVASEGS
jgi:hypothetical protein